MINNLNLLFYKPFKFLQIRSEVFRYQQDYDNGIHKLVKGILKTRLTKTCTLYTSCLELSFPNAQSRNP